MRKRLNNKGFSLIEVLVGVTILAVIAVPLAHSFITSAHTSVKAQNIQSETVAAQNILESYEATDIAGLINLAGSTKSFVEGTISKLSYKDEDGNYIDVNLNGDFDIETDGSWYQITLTGILVNSKSYDAILTVDADGDDNYTQINEQEIVQAKPMSAEFNLINDNPDIMAATDIADQVNLALFEEWLAAVANDEADPDAPPEQLTVEDFVDGMEREIIITISAAGDIDAQFKYTASYDGDDYEPSNPFSFPIYGDTWEEGEDYGLYFFYYPNQNITAGTDKILIYNEHNLEMNVYLIRQEIDDEGYNNDLNAPVVELFESGKSSEDAPSAMVYPNFETIMSFHYNSSWQRPIPCDGMLGGTVSQNRIYQVSVDLYEEDKAGQEDALLLQMQASSVE